MSRGRVWNKSKVVMLSAFGLGMLAPLLAFGQSDLPRRVQADLLENQIAEASQGCLVKPPGHPNLADCTATLQAIAQLKSIGERFPQPLLMTEAMAAGALGDHVHAFTALSELLKSDFLKDVDPQCKVLRKNADDKCKAYGAAIQLYPSFREAAVRQASEKSVEINLSRSSDAELVKILVPESRHRETKNESIYLDEIAVHLDTCVLTITDQEYIYPRGVQCRSHTHEYRLDLHGGIRNIDFRPDVIKGTAEIYFTFRQASRREYKYLGSFTVCLQQGSNEKPVGSEDFPIHSSMPLIQDWDDHGLDAQVRRRAAAEELSRRCSSAN